MTPTNRLRRWAIGTLLAASAVSLAGNVQHELIVFSGATSLIFAVAWAAVPPLALPLAVHLAGLMLTGGSRLRRTIATAVAAVAGIAFTVSFINLRALTEAMGSGTVTAVLFPLLVDLLAAISTVALLAQHATESAPVPAASPLDAHLDAAPEPVIPAEPELPLNPLADLLADRTGDWLMPDFLAPASPVIRSDSPAVNCADTTAEAVGLRPGESRDAAVMRPANRSVRSPMRWESVRRRSRASLLALRRSGRVLNRPTNRKQSPRSTRRRGGTMGIGESAADLYREQHPDASDAMLRTVRSQAAACAGTDCVGWWDRTMMPAAIAWVDANWREILRRAA